MASLSAFTDGVRERWRDIRWPKFTRPPKTALIWIAAILGSLLLVWVVLNLMLANPRFATPFVNWSLSTFGNKAARVETAKLSFPFSNNFQMRVLDWPGAVEAEEIEVSLDLLGWLPGRPWAHRVRLRNGEVVLAEKDNPTTLNPQALVDAIAAENIDLKFTRRGKPRSVKIVVAEGSFSSGSVSGEAISGSNRITFDGLQRNWDGGLRGGVTASGDNLKDLAEIVGASAPDTPPFQVDGELQMHERTWSVEGLGGRVGDSDIAGRVSVDLKPKKPFLTVDLKSNRLDFDDLGVVFGIPIGAERGETANAEQREAKAKFDRSSRFIPDTHLDFSRLAAVNGDINFEALKVVDAPMGISAMTLRSTLRDQVLNFQTARVATPSGNLDSKVYIDARKDPARSRASGTLRNLPISRIARTPFVRGSLNGAFVLNFTGSGFRDAAASTTGTAGIWSGNSEVAHIATEAAGLDLGEVLLDLAQEDEDNREYLKSRCLVANIDVKDGIATLNPALVDNKDSLIVATGSANLKNETLALEVKAEPHDVSLGKLFGDIKVTGTLRNPKVSAINAKTILQAGLSALLSTITGGLAALPFVELGGEPLAPCKQLVAEAKTTGPAKPAEKKKG